MMEETAKELKTRLYNTRIRECTAIKEAQAMRTDIYTYAPRSNATADYTALVKEILETEA
jgi:chromosome partitioning protein